MLQTFWSVTTIPVKMAARVMKALVLTAARARRGHPASTARVQFHISFLFRLLITQEIQLL